MLKLKPWSGTKECREMDSFYQKKIEQKWSLLDRWLDRNMYDQVQKGKKKRCFTLLPDKGCQCMIFFLQSRLQHTREKYDSSLKCIKAHYRRNIASYIMSQMEDLTEDIKGYQFRFLESMKSKYNYAETLKSIHLCMTNTCAHCFNRKKDTWNFFG